MGDHTKNVSIAFLFFFIFQASVSIGYTVFFVYTWIRYAVVGWIFNFGIANGILLFVLSFSCGISWYQNHRAKKIYIVVLVFSIASCICNVVMALELKKIIQTIDAICGQNGDSQTATHKHVKTSPCFVLVEFRKELIWLVVCMTAGIVSSVCTKILACIAMATNYENSLDEEQQRNEIEL